MSDEIEDSASERASSHTSNRMSSRIEVVSRVSGRRRCTVDQKLAVLRDAFGPDGCVRTACERHDIGSGSIYTWRLQATSGELAGVRKQAEQPSPRSGSASRQRCLLPLRRSSPA